MSSPGLSSANDAPISANSVEVDTRCCCCWQFHWLSGDNRRWREDDDDDDDDAWLMTSTICHVGRTVPPSTCLQVCGHRHPFLSPYHPVRWHDFAAAAYLQLGDSSRCSATLLLLTTRKHDIDEMSPVHHSDQRPKRAV